MKIALRAILFAFAVSLLASAAYADPQTAPATPGAMTSPTAAAPAGAKRNGPCKEDVQKLCATVEKGGGRVLACLKQNVGHLSPRCEAAMKRHADKDAMKPAQPMNSATPAPVTTPPQPPK